MAKEGSERVLCTVSGSMKRMCIKRGKREQVCRRHVEASKVPCVSTSYMNVLQTRGIHSIQSAVNMKGPLGG